MRALGEARRRHAQIAEAIYLQDVRALPPDATGRYDWIFCSGTFNIGFTAQQTYALLRTLFGVCTKGLVACFQNAYGTRGAPADDGLQRSKYKPDELYAVAKTFVDNIIIRDDYLPHDFLVAMLRQPLQERHLELTIAVDEWNTLGVHCPIPA